jgi:G3E family GTPase
LTLRPVVVAAGAAGSGKTSFLRRLTRQWAARGRACAVVLAEPDPFDAWSFSLEDVRVVEPMSGERLSDACARAAAGVDAVLVEASGGGGAFDAPVRLVVLVNAQQPCAAEDLPDAPSAVLVNKMDAASEAAAAAWLRAARERCPSSLVVPTVEGSITLDELDALEPRPAAAPRPAAVRRAWVALAEPVALSAAELLVHDPPRAARRVKGVLRVEGERHPLVVQVTGRSGSLRPWVAGPAPETGLVLALEASASDGAVEAEIRQRLRVACAVNPLTQAT